MLAISRGGSRERWAPGLDADAHVSAREIGQRNGGESAEWTPEDWDRVVSANLNACFLLAQHAAVTMRRQGRGRIIFTTSIAGVLGLGKVHGYTASKSGLIG